MNKPIVSFVVFIVAMWQHVYGQGQIDQGGPWWNFASVVIALWASIWLISVKAWNKQSVRPISMLEILSRGVLAIVFVKHGIGKVLAGPGPSDNQEIMFLVGLIEVGGALTLLVGPKQLRMLGSLGLAAIMLGAIFKIHFEAGYSMGQGWEYQFLLLVLCWQLYVQAGGWCLVNRLQKIIQNNNCGCTNNGDCCSSEEV